MQVHGRSMTTEVCLMLSTWSTMFTGVDRKAERDGYGLWMFVKFSSWSGPGLISFHPWENRKSCGTDLGFCLLKCEWNPSMWRWVILPKKGWITQYSVVLAWVLCNPGMTRKLGPQSTKFTQVAYQTIPSVHEKVQVGWSRAVPWQKFLVAANHISKEKLLPKKLPNEERNKETNYIGLLRLE